MTEIGTIGNREGEGERGEGERRGREERERGEGERGGERERERRGRERGGRGVILITYSLSLRVKLL